MEIQHQASEAGGSFYIDKEGERLAELVYRIHQPGILIAEHTEVSEALRGQQIGQKLVAALVNYALQNGSRIKALCPYAHAVMKKNAEYAKLLIDD